jgi:hypothetical protein
MTRRWRPHAASFCAYFSRLAADVLQRQDQEFAGSSSDRPLESSVFKSFGRYHVNLDHRMTKLYTVSENETLKRLAAFRIDAELLEGLETVWERDGVRPAEQVRRAIRLWLASKGVLKAERKRAATRKRP